MSITCTSNMNAFHAHIQVPRHLIMSTETFQYLKKPKTRNICVTQHLGRWLFDLYLVSASFPKPPGLFLEEIYFYLCVCVYMLTRVCSQVYGCPRRPEKTLIFSGARVIAVSSLMWVLEEQYKLLTTEPPLQPQVCF